MPASGEWAEFGAQRAGSRRAAIAAESAGAFGVLGVFVLVGGALGVVFFKALTSRPQVNLASGRIRVGRKSIEFADIDDATLEVEPLIRSRDLRLHFGVRTSVHVVIPLRFGDKEMLTRNNRDIVLDILERSSIQMPPDRYDPTGGFARYNFPTNVTRQQAIDLVRNPPGPKDPLPTVG